MSARPDPDTFVFDSDAHVLEPPELWQTYMPSSMRNRAIRFEPNAEGGERLVADGEVILEGRVAGLGGVEMDRSKLFLDPTLKYVDGAPRASMEGPARVELFDDWGVDAGLILPTVGILWDKDDNELANAYCRAYNDWVYDYQAANRDRLVIACHLNLHDIDGAIRELDERLRQGFKGVFLPPERVDGKRFADPYFDPLWARVEEAGIPLLPHVIVRMKRIVSSFVTDWYEPGQGNPLFTFGLGGTFQIVPAVVSMVADGLFDKFPALKVLAIESGCGWAAYVMDRMDEKYHHFSWAAPLKLGRPSDYFRRNLWFCAEPEERTIGAMLDLVGEDRILWGSDYPHIDSHIEAASQIRESVAALPDQRRRAVLGENARKLFGL